MLVLALLVPVALAGTTPSTTQLNLTSYAFGQVVALQATVAAPTGTAQGTVTFFDGSKLIGTAQLVQAGSSTPSSAIATYRTIAPPVGTHAFSAHFAGNTALQASTSSVVPFTGAATYPPGVTLSPSPTAAGELDVAVSLRDAAVPGGTLTLADASNNYLALATAPLTNGNTSYTLLTSYSFAGLNGPDAIAVVDVNGDGYPDVIVANYTDNTVSTILNPGTGGYNTPVVSHLANGDACPVALVTGDFNADGQVDVATANYCSNTVTILAGDGTGNFYPVIPVLVCKGCSADNGTVATGAGPRSLAVADIDGDGILDLVTGNYVGQSMTVLGGNGDGTFTARPTLLPDSQDLPAHPSAVALADFNLDGRLDLAVVYYNNAGLEVYLGTTTGLSPNPQPSITGSTLSNNDGATAIAVGDFNGDGIPDVAVSNFLTNNISVLKGDGHGYFSASSSVPFPATGAGPTAIVAADLNQDGFLDLVTANKTANTVTVLLGQGDSTFTAAYENTLNGTDAGPVAIAAGPRAQNDIPYLLTANMAGNTVTQFNPVVVGAASATFTNVQVPGAGMHNVVALLAATPVTSAAISNQLTLQASPLVDQLTVTAPPLAGVGDPVTLVAQLSPSSDSTLGTDGETVTFLSSGMAVGTAKLASGVASLSVPLPSGTNKVTASYLTDGFFASATAQPVSVTVGDPGAANSSLKGQYAFVFYGSLPFSGSQPFGVGAAASFTADGAGRITGGTEDINTAQTGFVTVALSGSYRLSADGTGTITLVNSANQQFTLAFAVSGLQPDGTAATANFTLLSNQVGVSGQGVMMQQTPASFTEAALLGSYVFGLTGETSCYAGCSSGHAGGTASETWMLAFDGHTHAQGSATEAIATSNYLSLLLRGNLVAPDATTGRTTLSLSLAEPSDQPADFIVYVVDASHLLLLSADPHSTKILLSGVGKRQ